MSEAEVRHESIASTCIGELEHHIHKVFASVRVPGEDFVYTSSNDLFAIIEGYCHDHVNGPKPPLLIIGEPGTGKSALLSNWLLRKHRNNLRSRSSVDEFIFWHAVGCSRQSTNVNYLIRRLLTDLKSRFELSRDVPVHQDQLSWELPRFLDLASKRGKIIIVIDGVNRLMSDDDNEASLTWLPLELPLNVRFVLSATIPAGETNYFVTKQAPTPAASQIMDDRNFTFLTESKIPTSTAEVPQEETKAAAEDPAATTVTKKKTHKSRILSELERRQWQKLVLKPLDSIQCRGLIQAFIQKTVQSEISAQATGPFLTALSRIAESSQDIIPGFLLFECHINSLLSHPQGGTPLFLRLFLRCAYLMCSRGFCLWQIWDDWLQAADVTSLLQRIMRSFENGFTKTAESFKKAIERTCHEGGLQGLQKIYQWHPAFQPRNEDDAADTIAAIDFAQVAGEKAGKTSNSLLTANRAKGKGGPALANTVLQSLGDQQWLTAVDQAEAKFEEARKRAERSVTEVVQKAIRDERSGLMDAILTQLPALAPVTHPEMLSQKSQSVNSLGSSDEENDEEDEEDEDDEGSMGESSIGDDSVSSLRESDTDSPRRKSSDHSESSSARKVHGEATQPVPMLAVEKEALQKVVGAFLAPVKEETSNTETTTRSNSANVITFVEAEAEQKQQTAPSASSPTRLPQILQSSKSLRGSKKERSFMHRSSSTKSFGIHSGKKSSRSHHHDGSGNRSDGSEGIERLPLYLRGGMNVPGLGPLLGNALAFLYVARHGLKEHEIWAMLASIDEGHQDQSKPAELTGPTSKVSYSASTSKEKKKVSKPGNTVADCQRRLLQWCHQERGSLEDIWRTNDMTQSGVITVAQLVHGWNKMVPSQDSGTNRAELFALLEIVEMFRAPIIDKEGNLVTPGIEASGFVFNTIGASDSMRVSYVELVKRIARYEQAARRLELKAKLAAKYQVNSSGKEKLDSFLLPSSNQSTDAEATHLTEHGALFDRSLEDQETPKKRVTRSLGPIVEESLLVVLCALGVLHTPENQVLILPLDSNLFRDVVRQNYVEQRGGETTWHGHLIRHFQCEINCMRRCEELPWHLQLCRKWYALKDTLTDLKTFQLMYGSDLKDELMSYWIALTEGPLFVTDEAHKLGTQYSQVKVSRKKNQMLRGEYGERVRLLSELDSASALGLSEKEARKQLLKDQIAPFDIVEEYNRSVEYWLTNSHPSDTLLGHMITQISRFLADFSRLTEPAPNFLRLGVELKSLITFGINFDHVKSIVDAVAGHQQAKILGEDDTAVAEMSEGATMFPTIQQMATNLYPYLRWIWIQFPWFAVEHAGEFGKLRIAAIREAKKPTRVGLLGTSLPSKEFDPESIQTIEAVPKKGKERYWKVMRRDPSLPIVSLTDAKKGSTMMSSIKHSSNIVKVIEGAALSLHYEDCSLFGGQRGRPDPMRQSTAKFRRSWEDEIDGLSGIPFSEHSVKSTNKSTLFPSVELFSRRRNEKMEQEDGELYTKAAAIVRCGGQCPNFEPQLEDELKHFLEAERLARFNDVHSGPIPLSESQAEMERESNRMAKLRTLADKAYLIRKSREKLFKELELRIITREQEDVNAKLGAVSGESMVESLQGRLDTLNSAVESAMNVSVGYQQILELVAQCPPYSDTHLLEVEQNLTLARQQLADLIQYRKNMYINAEKLEIVKHRQLMAKMSFYREARIRLEEKREAYMKKHGIEDVADNKGKARSDSYSHASDELELPGVPRPSPSVSRARKLRPILETSLSRAGSMEAEPSPVQGDVEDEQGAFAPTTESTTKVLATLVGAFQRVSKFNNILKSVTAPSGKSKTSEDDEAYDSEEEVAMSGREIARIASQQSQTSAGGAIAPGGSLPSTSPVSRNQSSRSLRRGGGGKRHGNSRNSTAPTHAGKKMHFEGDFHRVDHKGKVHPMNEKVAKESEAKAEIEYILEQTGSMNETVFIERFLNAQKMTDNIKAMQSLVDSKLAQLKTEYSELYGSWGKSLFEGNELNAPNGGEAKSVSVKHHGKSPDKRQGKKSSAQITSPSRSQRAGEREAETAGKEETPSNTEHDTRYFDKLLIEKEMKLSQLQKQVDNSLLLINEVRTGAGHLIAIITANSKLLHALPKSTPPPLNNDMDIVKCFSWCEERLLAINETMMLDSSKPQGGVADDTQPLHNRQTELASLVQGMLKDDTAFDKSMLKKRRTNQKKAGDMSRLIIDLNDTGAMVSNIKSVVVQTEVDVDKNFEDEMKRLEKRRDKREDALEALAESAVDVDTAVGVQKFLSEALSTHDSKEMLRKANVISRGKQGKNSGFGFTLENLLRPEGLSSSNNKTKGKDSGAGSGGKDGLGKASGGRSMAREGGGNAKTSSPMPSPGKDEISGDKTDDDFAV